MGVLQGINSSYKQNTFTKKDLFVLLGSLLQIFFVANHI
jgi:hypothetical protein